MGLIFKDANDQTPPDPKAARTRAILVSLPFALVGILALVFLLHDVIGRGFRMKKQMATGLLSAAVVCGGLIALIFGISTKKQALKISAAKTDGEKPWLDRQDWAAGRGTSSSRKAVALLWFFAIFWCAISVVLPVAVVLPEWQRGNHAALIALIFPVIGLALLMFALNTTLAWRRFGQSIFEMAAVPGALGGTVEGQIQVNGRLQPEHGLHLRLSCVRRATTGSGKNRGPSEKILWQDEKWLRPELPQTGANATGIPG